MNINKATLSGAVTTLALSVTLAACGGGSNSMDTPSATAPSASKTATKAPEKVSRDMQRVSAEMGGGIAAPSTLATRVSYHGGSPIILQVKEGTTVKEALAKAKVKVGTKDSVTPGINSKITKGNTLIAVTGKDVKYTSSAIATPQPSPVFVKDSNLAKGKQRVISQGKPGEKKVTYKSTIVNGKESAKQHVSTTVTSSPKATRIAVGTKVTPKATVKAKAVNPTTAPKAAAKVTPKPRVTQATPKPSASSANSGNLNTSNTAMWDKIAQCESSGNWSIVSSNGIYAGGLQFNRATWAEYGGLKYAPTANLATKAQQIDIANKLYAARGLQPWQCGWAAHR